MADTGSASVVGQPVAVVLNPIRPEKAELFESLIERLRPMVAELYPELSDRVRYLKPSAVDGDGSITYVFLFDPFQPEVDYSVANLVTEALGEEEAKAYMQHWGECFASAQVFRQLQQM